MYDILIKNGNIVDGSGKAAFKGDIAVKDGLIAKIAPCIEAEAAEVIDAWTNCTETLGAKMLDGFAEDNPIYMMADSGARGTKTQLRL